MKDGLLLVERLVLESLGKSKKGFDELMTGTGLSRGLLENVLGDLKERGLVSEKESRFVICRETLIEQGLNEGKAIKSEVKDLFVTFVNQYFEEEERKTRLKVRKVWVTPFEEKLLNSHFEDLERFVKSLEKRKGAIKESRVILWGEGRYGDLINREIEVA